MTGSTVQRPMPQAATSSERVGRRICEQADVPTHGELAYAVSRKPQASRHGKRGFPIVKEDLSDEILLENIAEGDKAAMHIMFARHRARVFRFAYRIVRNPTIAEDVVSQVFLDVWRSASRFENRARVTSWLLSIARFQAITATRERTHEDIDQDKVRAIADALDTPEAVLDRKETHGALQACMDKLSPAHREIIELFYLREKSILEVSEIVGIPQATVKSRTFYARKHLAKILIEAGLALTGSGDEAERARAVDD